MDTRIIDGAALSGRMRATLRDRAARLTARTGQPGLAVIIVGDNPASKVYVRHKVMACADDGVRSVHLELPDVVTEAELLGRIAAFNADPTTIGVSSPGNSYWSSSSLTSISHPAEPG